MSDDEDKVLLFDSGRMGRRDLLMTMMTKYRYPLFHRVPPQGL